MLRYNADSDISDPVSTVFLIAGYRHDLGERFLVHKEVACLYSPVLAKAFESKESDTFAVKSGSATTRRLVQWLYSQKLDLHHFHNDECNTHCYENTMGEETGLTLLWVLAKRLEISALQDQIIKTLDAMYQGIGFKPWVYCIKQVYKWTLPADDLRKWLIAVCAHGYDSKVINESYNFPLEFLHEVIQYSCTKLKDAEKPYNLSDFLCNAED